jgi:hypothetical protein
MVVVDNVEIGYVERTEQVINWEQMRVILQSHRSQSKYTSIIRDTYKRCNKPVQVRYKEDQTIGYHYF